MAMLPSCFVPAGALLQHVGRERYRGAALHFGASGANRYDDPDKLFGVLYLADELSTVLMESVFHQHDWSRGKRKITLTEATARMVRMVGVTDDLRLMDLSAPGAMAALLGLNLSQLVSRRYRHTQRVAALIHGDDAYDGIYYPSRNNYPAYCIALFGRAESKIVWVQDINLLRHIGWPGFLQDYRILVLPH